LRRAARQMNIIIKTIDTNVQTSSGDFRADILEQSRKHFDVAARAQVFMQGRTF